jgi:two-component SAPR family response regulator
MVNSTLHQKESRPIQQYTSPLVRTTKRILIVNYENDVNFALKLVLEEQRSGGQDRSNCFKVDSFNYHIPALKHLEKEAYDLLIIAVVMPEINGFDFAKQLRNIDDKVKKCFLITGEITNKLRFDRGCEQEESQDKFIKLTIENHELMQEIDKMIR